MLALCLLLCLFYVCFTSAVEYTFQQPELPDFFAKPHFHKTVKTYYYKTPPQYQVHYERVKVPLRRPHTVYVPKPYFVKVPSSQHFTEYHAPYSYRIERPIQHLSFEQKIPFNSKFYQNVKVPISNQVSVTVEKPLLLPDFEKPIFEKPQEEPFEGYFSLPEAIPQFEVKKEKHSFPGFNKELFAQQLNAGSILSSDLAEGKQQHVSFPSELQKSKIVFEPIVVSEEPKKWKNLSNLSEWVPRYEISDVKPTSSDVHNSAISERQKFELSEVKIPLQESHLLDELTKNSFESLPNIGNVTYQKHFSFLGNPLSNQESSNTNKNHQLYHISSNQVIKPEALISSDNFQNFNSEEKSTMDSSEKWITGQEQYAAQNESPLRFDRGQPHVPSLIEPNKHRAKNQVKYTIQNGPTNNLQDQYTIEYEPSNKLTKSQEKDLAQNEATRDWLKSNEQHTSQKQPEPHWLMSGGQHSSQKEPTYDWFKTQGQVDTELYVKPQLSLQEIQSPKQKPELQASQSLAQSTQHFSMSPQYEFPRKEVVVEPQSSIQNDKQEKQYYTFPPQFESNFKPLISVKGHTPYIQPLETNEQSSQPQIQNYVLRNPLQNQQADQQQQQQQQQHTQQDSQQQNRQPLQIFYHPQTSPVHQTPQNYQKHEKASLLQDHSSQNELPPQQNHQEATSHISYQQYFPETQYHQQIQQTPQNFPQSQSKVEPQQFRSSGTKHSYWHHGPQREVFKKNTMLEGRVPDGPESLEQHETKTKNIVGDLFSQKSRRLRQPMSVGVTDHLVRLTRVTTTATTEDPSTTTTTVASTTSHLRKKHRRKHRRRNNNQETTTQLPEQ